MEYGHWNYDLVGLFDPTDWFGFIYLIENATTGQKYIGKKQFLFKKARQIKGRKKAFFVESDWKTYGSSSEPLLADIELFGKDNFRFTILELCSGKAELSFLEEQYQYGCGVLFEQLEDGSRAYYNKTIAHRHFAGVESQSIKSREKRSISLRKFHEENPGANIRTEESRRKISASLARHFSSLTPEERRAPRMSISPEMRRKLSSHAASFTSLETRKRGGHTAGTKLFEQSRGFFAWDDEKRIKTNSKGGSVAGKLHWWNDGVRSIRTMTPPNETWVRGRVGGWKWKKNEV